MVSILISNIPAYPTTPVAEMELLHHPTTKMHSLLSFKNSETKWDQICLSPLQPTPPHKRLMLWMFQNWISSSMITTLCLTISLAVHGATSSPAINQPLMEIPTILLSIVDLGLAQLLPPTSFPRELPSLKSKLEQLSTEEASKLHQTQFQDLSSPLLEVSPVEPGKLTPSIIEILRRITSPQPMSTLTRLPRALTFSTLQEVITSLLITHKQFKRRLI
jgi:hypothetical protein